MSDIRKNKQQLLQANFPLHSKKIPKQHSIDRVLHEWFTQQTLPIPDTLLSAKLEFIDPENSVDHTIYLKNFKRRHRIIQTKYNPKYITSREKSTISKAMEQLLVQTLQFESKIAAKLDKLQRRLEQLQCTLCSKPRTLP